MLQSLGREDYYKFRLPYWDWRREIQASYGLPSEELFSFNHFGETRNVSNRPVVFGDLVGDWTTICHVTLSAICNPALPTGNVQRCPFIGNPILCHSSNPDWPSLQEVNLLLKTPFYDTEPFNVFSANSFRDQVDFNFTLSVEECHEDVYCRCIPGGTKCEDVPANTEVTTATVGVHAKVSLFVFSRQTSK